MQVRSLVILAIILFLFGLCFYVFFYSSNDHSIEFIKPISGPAIQAVYATGTVEPSVMIPVAPRISARLVKLMADEGIHVTKNQILAQLEDEDLQQELTDMRAKADLAKRDYERKVQLVDSGASSRRSVEEAKANWESTQAKVAQANANLGYAKLIAPEDGIVIRRDGEVGELISSNKPVFWLSCCANLRISAEVDEEDISLVKIGQDVLIRADAFQGDVFTGSVLSITPKGDPISRSYRVRVSLLADTPLLIGMTAETNIIIRKTDQAILVPASSIKDNFVWVIKNGRAHLQNVRIGAKTPQAVEVINGISLSDFLVYDFTKIENPEQPIRSSLKDWKAH